MSQYDDNGWRHGTDPLQRWLRVAATILTGAVVVYLVLDGQDGRRDLPSIGLALGAMLVLLGYESLVRLPGIGKRRDD